MHLTYKDAFINGQKVALPYQKKGLYIAMYDRKAVSLHFFLVVDVFRFQVAVIKVMYEVHCQETILSSVNISF